MTGSARRVAEGQQKLAQRMQEADKQAQSAQSRVHTVGLQARKDHDNLRVIGQLVADVDKLTTSIRQLGPMLTQLNNMLPPDSRLEPFAFSAPRPAEASPPEPS